MQVLTLNEDQLIEFASDLEASGPFCFAYFMKYIKKDWSDKTIKRIKTWIY